MVKLAAICVTLLSCLAFAPASASAAPAQQPPYFTVSLATENGSGCPAGTTTVSQPNNTSFTVLYNNYQAEAGAGASPFAFHENCTLNVSVGVPSGWTYGITEVDTRGYAHLDAGAQGTLTAYYNFSAQPTSYQTQHPLSGPQDGNYTFTDQVPTIAWAPCSFTGTLNIDTSASVTAGSDPSFAELLTVDSHNVSAATIYHLSFEQC